MSVSGVLRGTDIAKLTLMMTSSRFTSGRTVEFGYDAIALPFAFLAPLRFVLSCYPVRRADAITNQG